MSAIRILTLTTTDPDLEDLLGKLCNGILKPPESDRLVEMLRNDASNRQFYTDYLDAHLALIDLARRGEPRLSAGVPRPMETQDFPNLPMGTPVVAGSVRPGVPNLSLPSLYVFVAAAAASLLMAIGIWQMVNFGASGKDQPRQLARSVDNGTTNSNPDSTSDPFYVAQVTDVTADVTWGKTAASQEFLLRMRRGDRIEISSGLVQLDYFSGARIILQGPCAFVPTGENSGRIEYGSLTGNVSKGDFVLTTPTAKVIDLGTEFGVSVDGIARTELCVFDGEVRVFAGPRGEDAATSVLLREGMKASVASGGRIADAPELDVLSFARELPTTADVVRANQISLVDLLSGSAGNRRRLAGVIAPDSGDSDLHPWLRVDGPGYSLASGYRETSWHPFVDGVFIPFETGADTRIDSSGNTVDLPASTGRTWGPIWSRRRMPGVTQVASQEDYWGTDTLDVVIARLSECETGMIGIHSNAGVTFDLEAVRRCWEQPMEEFAHWSVTWIIR